MKNIILGVAVCAVLILLAMKLMSPSVEGQWVADHIVDNQSDTLKIDASLVQLHIEEDRYTFLSTLNLKEVGSIRRSGDQLIVQNEGAQPYKMDISHLSESQMTLVMKVDNTPRTMVMRRLD